MSEEKNKLKKKKWSGLYWGLGAALFAVSILLFCQFYFVDNASPNDTFLKGTMINGIDVSGMTKNQAENVISYSLLSTRADIKLTLSYEDKTWTFAGSDFEVKDEVGPVLTEVMKVGHEGNFLQRYRDQNKIKKDGLAVNVSYKTVLGGLDEKIDQIASEIESPGEAPEIIFDPNADPMFSLSEGKPAIVVDRGKLLQLLDDGLEQEKNLSIEIPIIEIPYEIDEDALLSAITKRSSFSTNYSSSSAERKNNVALALKAFNGQVFLPEEEVSFNTITGSRTLENGYKPANVILNGAYVKGVGGGVCQASTTLYNALVLADIEILQVNHHSIPASYVPLSFDAMVSEGYSDLVFKNSLNAPIYIKTYSDDENVYVEIYGPKFDNDKTIKTRAEFIKVLPHSGDKIIQDTTGEYADKVIYKGEYYRVRYPREGYESKGYVQYYEDDELVSEKEIRHDKYLPQEGIIVEGTAELGEGMTLPENDVEFIPPQKVTSTTTETVRAKIEKERPSAYNP